MADAPKLTTEDLLHEGVPKINAAIDNANEALIKVAQSEAKTESVQTQLDTIVDELPFIEKDYKVYKNPLTVTGHSSGVTQVAYEFNMTAYAGQTVNISLESFLQKKNNNFQKVTLFRWDSDGTILNFNPTGAVNIGSVDNNNDFGDGISPYNLSFSYTVTKSKLFLVFGLYQNATYNPAVRFGSAMKVLINGVETIPSDSGIGKTFGSSFARDLFGFTSGYVTSVVPIGSTMIENKAIEPSHLLDAKLGKNLFNPAKVTVGYYVDGLTGILKNNLPGQNASDFIPVTAGQKITASRTTYYAIYNTNKTFITGENTSGSSPKTITIPANGAFVRMSVADAYLATYQLEIGAAATNYEPYGKYKLSNLVVDFPQQSGWEGKSTVAIGDSILHGLANFPTVGSVVSKRWSDIVAENLKMSIINYGISSSTIAVRASDPTGRNPMVNRFSSMVDGADLAIVAGGTNDWQYSWTPLGDMTSRDVNTFYGALHTLCLGLLEKYPAKQIMFITPIKRHQAPYDSPTAVNANGKTLKEYGDIIKEVCGYYGIPVLDGYSKITINPHIQTQADLLVPDKTHPNDLGHQVYAKPVTGFIRGLA
ncbi:TPA: SGNH/GDSL hydrolase family protein [Bacillus luti]